MDSHKAAGPGVPAFTNVTLLLPSNCGLPPDQRRFSAQGGRKADAVTEVALLALRQLLAAGKLDQHLHPVWRRDLPQQCSGKTQSRLP
jgi:hypothetical protein